MYSKDQKIASNVKKCSRKGKDFVDLNIKDIGN